MKYDDIKYSEITINQIWHSKNAAHRTSYVTKFISSVNLHMYGFIISSDVRVVKFGPYEKKLDFCLILISILK